MENNQSHALLGVRKDWVRATLFPSITSGCVGGAVVGCFCGWLLAFPHHFLETIIGSTLIGAILGFVIAWVGAALVGILRYMFR